MNRPPPQGQPRYPTPDQRPTPSCGAVPLVLNPTGAPDSPTFQKILRLLFTPEEARIARVLPQFIDLDDLADRLGLPVGEVGKRVTARRRSGLRVRSLTGIDHRTMGPIGTELRVVRPVAVDLRTAGQIRIDLPAGQSQAPAARTLRPAVDLHRLVAGFLRVAPMWAIVGEVRNREGSCQRGNRRQSPCGRAWGFESVDRSPGSRTGGHRRLRGAP